MPAPNFLTAPPCNLGAEIPCIIGGKPYPWPTPALEFLHTLARVRACARTGEFCPPPELLGVTTFTRPVHLSKLFLSRVRAYCAKRGISRACAYLSRDPDNAAAL